MENNNEKQLKVSAIKNGTVLDHIPSGQVFKVIDILGLYDSPHPVTFGVNLDSRSMGSKGIIKISERFFKDDELNKIALIAPNASVNIIREEGAHHPRDHHRDSQVHQPHVRDQSREHPYEIQNHRKRLQDKTSVFLLRENHRHLNFERKIL